MEYTHLFNEKLSFEEARKIEAVEEEYLYLNAYCYFYRKLDDYGYTGEERMSGLKYFEDAPLPVEGDRYEFQMNINKFGVAIWCDKQDKKYFCIKGRFRKNNN